MGGTSWFIIGLDRFVVDTINPWVYKVRSMVNGKEMAVHVRRIAKYENKYFLSEDEIREEVIRSTKGFQIDRVIDSRWNDATREYELRCSWLGLETNDDTCLCFEEVVRSNPDLLDRHLLKAELNPP